MKTTEERSAKEPTGGGVELSKTSSFGTSAIRQSNSGGGSGGGGGSIVLCCSCSGSATVQKPVK